MYNENNLPFSFRRYNRHHLKEFRKLRNMTLEQFAEVMEIAPSTVSRIESGEYSMSLYYLTKFLHALQILRASDLEIDTVLRIVDVKQHNQNKLKEIDNDETI